MKNTIKINEIFEDIEGEGLNQGIPTIFVRLAGCNLRCAWCDTKYAYYKGRKMDIAVIAGRINRSKCGYVNITGGEPLLCKGEVKKLIKKIKNKFVAVETNGSVSVRGTGADMISMDYKLPSSREHKKMLKSNLKLLRKKDQLKLVIGSVKDMNYARGILRKNKVKARIIAQPVWKKFSIDKIRKFVLKNDLNWRVGVQLHKLI